jgi:hypothetical protein
LLQSRSIYRFIGLQQIEILGASRVVEVDEADEICNIRHIRIVSEFQPPMFRE